jgi:hypothetical protein
VSYAVTPGDRAVGEIDGDRYGEDPFFSTRLAGRHVFDVGVGTPCFTIRVRDVLDSGHGRQRCYLRPDLPTHRSVLRGCTERIDRRAYLGRAVACTRSRSSMSIPIGSSGEETVTIVLRTCPDCGSVRIALVSDSERQARGIDLRTPRRGRRVVTMTMTYARWLHVSIPEARSGVFIEGIDT